VRNLQPGSAGELDVLADQARLPRELLEDTLQKQEKERAASRAMWTLYSRRRRRRRWALVLFFIAAYLIGTVIVLKRYAEVPEDRPSRASISGDWFYRDGHKFLVKGVGWDPARPGELPWARKQSIDLVDEDFRRIREAGFNTIRTWEALSWSELEAAERHGLAVLQGIWIEPDGDFRGEQFQRQTIKKVRDIVGYSKESSTIIGYLVMNEPEAEHVFAQGLETTLRFLRLVASEIRRLDPAAHVAFSSWPGLEFLVKHNLDFAGVNLYPFRPIKLIDAVGYEGMVRLWKDLHGSGRPLLVTEYGLSVSPEKPAKANAPGGTSEEEQAARLPQMADQMLAAGAAGGAVFAWNDGWWKGQNRPEDALFHDADDPEEWFGLLAMEHLQDLRGRERPALDAMRRWNRIVVTSPANGPVNERAVLLEMNAENDEGLLAAVSLNGGEAFVVPLTREGPWFRGWIGLALEKEGAQHLEIYVYDETGLLLRHLERTVYPPGEAPRLELEMAKDGLLHLFATDGSGGPLPNAQVRVAVTTAAGTNDFHTVVHTNEQGAGYVELNPPEQSGAFVAAGLWRAAGKSPAAVKGIWVSPRLKKG
jgi:hypothetical protein